MKHSIPLALCLMVALGGFPSLVRASSQKPSALPSEVRTRMPTGATSFLAVRLPIGYKGTTRFVHIWGVVRPNAPDSLNHYDSYADSPFCIDIFEPRRDAKNRWRWHFVASAAYVDQNEPLDIVAHWLRPATKQGPVLEVISSNNAPGISTMHRVFAWPQGFEAGYGAPTPQIFGSGGSGGGTMEQSFGGVDGKGYMTITSRDSYNGKTISTTISRWNGERFVAPDEVK